MYKYSQNLDTSEYSSEFKCHFRTDLKVTSSSVFVCFVDLLTPVFSFGPKIQSEVRKKIRVPVRSPKFPEKKIQKCARVRNFFSDSGGLLSGFGPKSSIFYSGKTQFSDFGTEIFGPKFFGWTNFFRFAKYFLNLLNMYVRSEKLKYEYFLQSDEWK